MKRRNFISSAASMGLGGFLAYGCASSSKTAPPDTIRFDIHPFVQSHPEAVFIYFTTASSKTDSRTIHDAADALARDLIVRTYGAGFLQSEPVTIKPDWSFEDIDESGPPDGKTDETTDTAFVEGWVGGMRVAGPSNFCIRESSSSALWEQMGWTAMCGRAGIDLRDLSNRDAWDLKKDREVIFRPVRNGVVLREAAFMAPAGSSGTCIINIAKLKPGPTGIAGAVRNLRGLCARRFNEYLTPHTEIRKRYEQKYLGWFRPDFETHIETLYAQHVKHGIPRWNRPGPDGGILMEQWAQRAIDTAAAIPAALHMVEGVYARNARGFDEDTPARSGRDIIARREYLPNIVLFGRDPFRVDIVAHYIAGQEPGNFGIFHLANERGVLDVLDYRDIPLYSWKDGRAAPLPPGRIPRIPLVSTYLRRDYNGMNEPEYHLVNEPFDYAEWKKTARLTAGG